MSPKSLSRILAVKERVRQWKRAELAAANASLDVAQREVEAREQMRKSTADAITNAKELTGDELAARADVLSRAHKDLSVAESKLRERHAERDAQGEQVAIATRDVRVLETLRERMTAEEDKASRNREQTELDDQSAHRVRPL